MNEDKKFNKIFYFVAAICGFVLIYILMISFIPVPKENSRYVDIALAFLMGTVLGGGINYLLGGSPDKKKPEPPAPDVNTTINNNP